MRIYVKLLLAASTVLVGYARVQAPDRESRWREDFQFLAKGLSAKGTTIDLQRGISSRGQKDFEKLYPKETFDAEIVSLSSEVATLPDSEIVLRLMRLMASSHVAHNIVRIPLSNGFFNRLPIEFSWFSDGLAVTAASADQLGTLGTRVVKVGSMTPEELLVAVTPYISHENDSWLRSEASGFIRWGAVLRHFHLLDSDRRLALTLERPGGEMFTVSVPVVDPRVKTQTLTEGLHLATLLALSRPTQNYWHQFLPESQTCYIQFNACANDPQVPFKEFAKQVLADIDARAPKKIVIDLRANSGGDSRIISPLEKGLAARLKTIEHIYVLIGPATFSSAVDNAVELRRSLKAILVGTDAGQGAGGYGEVKLLTLPNSKLVVQYTTKFFGAGKEFDALSPDLKAPRKLEDALAGRDTALEAALRAK